MGMSLSAVAVNFTVVKPRLFGVLNNTRAHLYSVISISRPRVTLPECRLQESTFQLAR